METYLRNPNSQKPEIGWSHDSQPIAVTLPESWKDEPEITETEREQLRAIVNNMLRFCFQKPWGKWPAIRLLTLGAALGVNELHGWRLVDIAIVHDISKKDVSVIMKSIRSDYMIEAANIATARFQNCTTCHVKIHGSQNHVFYLR